MSKVVKIQPDKFKKVVAQQDLPKRPATLGENVKLTNWLQKARDRQKIHHFSIVAEGKAYVYQPQPGQAFVVIVEDMGDRLEAWVVCVDDKTGEERFRKNPMHIDMISWEFEPEKPIAQA